jgi:hypothetical protein
MAFDIVPYQVRVALHQGRNLAVYRANRASDGVAFVAKIPNSNRPSGAVCDRLNNEFWILQQLNGASPRRTYRDTEVGNSRPFA